MDYYWLKLKNMQRDKYIVIVLLFFFNFGLFSEQDIPSLKKLDYNVEVILQTIPFYAIDRDGKPVFDLKESEILLRLNGKRKKFLAVSGYRFRSVEEQMPRTKSKISDVTGSIKKMKKSRDVPKPPERYIFLILDKIFNSTKGIIQSKKIMREIVRKSSLGDSFILLELHKWRGLVYKLGPIKGHDKIFNYIESIPNSSHAKFNISNVASSMGRESRFQVTGKKSVSTGRYFKQLGFKEAMSESLRYASMGKLFTRAIGSFKLALNTITKPKLLYLISEGMKIGLLKQRDHAFYYQKMKDTAKSVNKGGSMFFIMDSNVSQNRLRGGVGRNTLKYLSEESGGRYFGGRNYANAVAQLNRTTGAYYELVFDQEVIKGLKEDIKVTLECTRKGIALYSINRTNRKVRYKVMPKAQKNLFALNVIQGGAWSRISGEIHALKPSSVKLTSTHPKKIQIQMPEMMRGKLLDMFVVSLNPETLKADFLYRSIFAGKTANCSIPSKKKREQYLVIVEPERVLCTYLKL